MTWKFYDPYQIAQCLERCAMTALHCTHPGNSFLLTMDVLNEMALPNAVISKEPSQSQELMIEVMLRLQADTVGLFLVGERG